MSNIAIGNVTPKINPAEMTLIRPDKKSAIKPTYGGVAYFGWPATIVGLPIDLTWDQMDADDFAALDVLYAADAPVVFNPNDGLGKTFNVYIVSLDGKYLIGLNNSSASRRADVKMTLLIMSQV